jgi:lipopolysaccharide/colanic/teichoic acid biosynthesis glycosyltransferase
MNSPQMINVLKGDMSFVGPRPERPFFVDQLKKEIPYYDQRHTVHPGVTGWAQIRYPYGASKEDALEKLKYDLCYIKNFTVTFDLYIIFETARVVLLKKGRDRLTGPPRRQRTDGVNKKPALLGPL